MREKRSVVAPNFGRPSGTRGQPLAYPAPNCRAQPDRPDGPRPSAGGSAKDTFARAFRRVFGIVRDVVNEVFDEAAYSRYLIRTGVGSSSAAYRGFLRECAGRHERTTRCC